MDSLTQILLGASIGEKVLGKKLGNKALFLGAIAGTIPDLDVWFGKFYDPITAIEIHRSFSHSILFFLLLSPVLGFLLSKLSFAKEVSFKEATIFWFLGLFTHAVLDAFTTWGTQLFFPFGNPISFNSIFVIDPMYTLPFLFCMIMVLRYKKEEITKRQFWVNSGLLISTIYLAFTIVVQQIVTQKIDVSLKEKNIVYDRKIVKPSPFNIILWNTVVETKEGFYFGDYSFFDTKPINYRFFTKNNQLLEKYNSLKQIRQLKKISDGFWLVTQNDDRLFFNDARFGLLTFGDKIDEFSFSYEIIDTKNQVEVVEVTNKSKGRAKELLHNLWLRLRGN